VEEAMQKIICSFMVELQNQTVLFVLVQLLWNFENMLPHVSFLHIWRKIAKDHAVTLVWEYTKGWFSKSIMTKIVSANKSMCVSLYQFWTNVSDLYVSWSKVAIGLIIHKNDKKSWMNRCLTPPLWAFPWKQPKK